MSEILKMLEILPGIKHKKYTNANCMYGFNHILSNYSGITDIDFSAFSWSHGWIADPFKVNPQDVICGRGNELKEGLIFVARRDQCHYLTRHGFHNTVAAGLPITYVEKQSFDRIPGSLLIMPVHTGDAQFLIGDFKVYADYFRSLKSNYDYIAVCIHPSCLMKGYWVKEFSELDIPIITGSSFQDENGLLRIAHLLSSFDTITTNGFGSHIAYAASLGCRVSVFDPCDGALKTTYDHDFQPKSQTVEIYNKLSYQNIQKTFPFLVNDPINAKKHIAWGNLQIGALNKKSPDELAEILPRLKSRSLFSVHSRSMMERAKRLLKSQLRSETSLLESFCLNQECQLDEESLNHYVKPKILNNVPILGSCFISQNSDLTEIINTYIKDLYSLKGINASHIVDICPDSGFKSLYLAQQYPQKVFYLFAQTDLSHNTIKLNLERLHLDNVQLKRLNITINPLAQTYCLNHYYPNRYEPNTLLDGINSLGPSTSFPTATAHINDNLCLCLQILSHELTIWIKWISDLKARPEYLLIDFFETIGSTNNLHLLLDCLHHHSYKYFCHSAELASPSEFHKLASSSYPFYDSHYIIKAYRINPLQS